jgi:hypothetical protein
MNATAIPLALDPLAVRYPTDGLTLRRVATEDPEQFTMPALQSTRLVDLDLGQALKLQYILAEKAFAKTIGKSEPYPDESRDIIVPQLSAIYRQYGLAVGIKQTEELVRLIEAQAAEQATAGRGR